MSGVEADILARIASLNLWKWHGERAPHKALLILLALGRLQRDEPRLAPFAESEPRPNEVLQEFGTPSTRPSAQYPFWRLRGDGLWEVEAPVDLAPCGRRPRSRSRAEATPTIARRFRSGLQRGLPRALAGRSLDDDIGQAVTLAPHQHTLRRLDEAEKTDLVRWMLEVDEDVLGVYEYGRIDGFAESSIELYWPVVGLCAGWLGTPVEGLAVVVLTHELAHAYTHLGRGIDG